MRHFPLFLDLQGRDVAVVGGGEVALRKVQALLSAGAVVTVVAPELHEALAAQLVQQIMKAWILHWLLFVSFSQHLKRVSWAAKIKSIWVALH